ncbi:MAG: amidohydrolase family protein [Xanthobacteraceae bacterium]|nr:amidohydrolase family protein [Xanthobacteraceae bacterium]
MADIVMRTAMCFIAMLFAVPVASAQAPDLILHNGKIVTVDSGFSIASAVAIRGDRIVAVGTDEDVRKLAGPATRQSDLAGRTVIPGLIDNHLHYLRGATFTPFETRLEGVLTRKAALEKIAARAKELGPGSGRGKWIFVIGGWHEQQFQDKPGGFTLEELDAASPHNPVFIQKTYSAFYMNTLARDLVAPNVGALYKGKLPIETVNIEGRRVMYAALRYAPIPIREVVPAASQLSQPNAHREEPDAPPLPADQIRAYNSMLNSMGLTTVYDVGYLDGTHAPLSGLHATGALTLRVFWTLQRYARDASEVDEVVALIEKEKPLNRNDWFGIIGIGEHVFPGIQDSGLNASRVFPKVAYDQFAKLATAAAKAGWPIHQHLMVNATIEGYLSISEEIAKTTPIAPLRWTIAHADLITKESLEKAKRLGWVIALHNQVVKPLNPLGETPPVKMIHDSGIMYGLGSDGSIVATVNPFLTLWQYTSGRIFPDKVLHKETITREQALIAHTRSNAYLLFMEKDLGTLETGKLADLVVLDRDYLTVPVDQIREIQPVMTMVGGKIVHGAL